MSKLNKFINENRPKVVTVLVEHDDCHFTVEDLYNYGPYLGFKYCGCDDCYFAPFKLARTEVPTESYWKATVKLEYINGTHRDSMLRSFNHGDLCLHLETTDKAEAVALAIKLYSSARLN